MILVFFPNRSLLVRSVVVNPLNALEVRFFVELFGCYCFLSFLVDSCGCVVLFVNYVLFGQFDVLFTLLRLNLHLNPYRCITYHILLAYPFFILLADHLPRMIDRLYLFPEILFLSSMLAAFFLLGGPSLSDLVSEFGMFFCDGYLLVHLVFFFHEFGDSVMHHQLFLHPLFDH